VRRFAPLVLCLFLVGCATPFGTPYEVNGARMLAECSGPKGIKPSSTVINHNYNNWMAKPLNTLADKSVGIMRQVAILVGKVAGGVSSGGTTIIFETIPGMITASADVVDKFEKFKTQTRDHEYEKLSLPKGIDNFTFVGRLGDNCVDGVITTEKLDEKKMAELKALALIFSEKKEEREKEEASEESPE